LFYGGKKLNSVNKNSSFSESNIKKNTYFIALSQAFNLILALGLNIMAGRYLGDEGFGKYAFATVIYYFVFLFDDFGIVTYFTREVARNREQANKYFTNSAVLKLILISVSVLFLGLYLSIFSFPADKALLIILFGIYGIIYSFNQLCSGVYRGFEQMQYEMAVVMIEKILVTAAGIYVLVKGLGLVAFGSVFVFSGIISLVINFILVKVKFRISWTGLNIGFMRSMFKAAVILGFFMFLAQAHARIDVLLLSAMKGDSVAGWYSAPYKILLFLEVIPTILFTSTFPRLSRTYLTDKNYIEKIYTIGFKYLFYIAVPVIAGTMFLAPEIMSLFGSEFTPSVPVLRIVIFAAGFNFFNIFTGGLLIASNKQKEVLKVQTGGLLLNLVINFILIPSYAHIGASIATFISYGSVLAVTLVITYRSVCRINQKSFFWKGAVSTAAMTLFLAFTVLPFLPKFIIAVGIYAAVLLIFKGIDFNEILHVKKIRAGKNNGN